MSHDAESTVYAVMAYAEENKNTPVHRMSLAEFGDLANLLEQTIRNQIISIFAESRRATMAVRVFEYSSSGKKESPSGSWPIFLFVLVTNTDVSIEVCPHTWADLD